MIRKSTVALLTVLLVTGCATTGPVLGPTTADTSSADQQLDVLEEGVIENDRVADEQQALAAELLRALTPDAEEEPLVEEQRFDLSVSGASSQDFFRGLVKDTAYNMVVHPEVNGEVSLELKNVTVRDVMEVMRDVYGYDYLQAGSLIQVYPDVLRTEIFQINYLNVERSGRSEMQVSAGKVSDAGSSGSTGSSGGGGNRDSDRGDRGGGSVVGTVVNTEAATNFWAELRATLESIVFGDEGARVVVTPQVGLAVVRAKPESLHAVRGYLSQVESTLHRQVILEAKILEVTLREGFQAGINWSTFGEDSGGTFKPTTVVDENGVVTVTAGSRHATAGELTSGAADFFNPLGTAFTLNGSYGDFEAAIDLLSTQGSVQVLSSPRIATVNNQKAVIKVGSDEFFVTDISSDTITAGSAINTIDSPELTPFFSGIALDVTPQISESGNIILHVHPTVSEVSEQLKSISGESVPLAASTIRESDSIVRARNGQIVVIGGLMQNSSKDDNAGIPLLKSIPGLGHLFKQKTRSNIKSELVILLKPVIVDDDSQNKSLSETTERIKALRELLNKRG